MRTEELRALLRQVDDPVAAERPSTQDLQREMALADAFVDTLRQRFGGVSAEVGPPMIQDASHLASIGVAPESLSRGHGMWVRLSNFGRLASAGAVPPAAHGDEEISRLIADDDWQAVMQLLESHGYRYVPQDLLLEDYDGSNDAFLASARAWRRHGYRGGSERVDWWTRFFDYI